MRILHLADRLTDRGGAYTWLLGILEGLSADHEQRLVVGEDPGEARARCRVVVRPGLESRVAQPVPLDDLVADFRPDLIHLHNVTNPLVLEWAATRRGAERVRLKVMMDNLKAIDLYRGSVTASSRPREAITLDSKSFADPRERTKSLKV